ncbi:MAG TPA: ATP-binding protein [Candidatus Polarisedimenticolaceae bacterium]|nr:ATP-binding protein [Candidatus Polarisedimenticolaceae bacterium]
MVRLRSLLASFLIASAIYGTSHAAERLSRTFGYQSGLAASSVAGVVQDRTGFLWIATPTGLYRFDGREFLKISPASSSVIDAAGAFDDVYFTDTESSLWRAHGASAEPVTDAEGRPVVKVHGAAVSDDGALWVHPEGPALLRRDPRGSWTRIEAARETSLDGFTLFPGRHGSILALDPEGAVRIAPDGTRTRLVSAPETLRVEEPDDRTIVCARWRRGVFTIGEIQGGVEHDLLSSWKRLVGLRKRGEAVWIAFDTEIDVVRPGQPPEMIGRDDGLRGCNSIYVDREGSLWVASYEAGLMQYPEPDTVMRQMPGFLPAVRSLSTGKLGIWAGGWFGTELLDLTHGKPGVLRRGPPTLTFPCPTDGDAVWTVVRANELSLWGPEGQRRVVPMPGVGVNHRCAEAGDGGVWMPTDAGLIHASHDTTDVRMVVTSFPGPPARGPTSWRAFESRDGELFVARDETICRQRTREVLAGVRAWTCETLKGASTIVDFLETPRGSVWTATSQGGLFAFDGRTWQPAAGNDDLPSRLLNSLSPGGDGTTWITGAGFAVRVREGDAGRLAIVESLSAWQGMPSLSISEIVETPDRDLYIGMGGIAYTPASSRLLSTTPPTVVLVAATADGSPLPDTPSLVLPYRRNRLELRFAALSYRDPSRIRYRTRLRAGEDWSTETTEPSLHFADLAPGAYDVGIEATLDGARWSERPASFAFRVARPWYLEPWFFAAAAIGGAALLYVGFRVRVGQVIRLERQRARIAMDLHDELGSGLGSIGLLSSVLSREGLDAEKRVRAGAQLGDIAGGLSASLTDIVWSLKPGAATLESLAAHLVARGGALFPDDRPRFVSEIPSDLPAVPLSLAVRRNAFLVGLEALHNAAQHARAEEVRLALVPEGRRWRLTVTDDGAGMPAEPSARLGSGLGLDSMRRRAEEIDAKLTWSNGPHAGTVVSLVFAPGSE